MLPLWGLLVKRKSCFRGGIVNAVWNKLFPPFIKKSLKQAISFHDSKVWDFCLCFIFVLMLFFTLPVCSEDTLGILYVVELVHVLCPAMALVFVNMHS